jgi:hypothetical protein
MSLGFLLIASINPDERAEGRRLLWPLAVGHGPFQSQAVDALVPSRELNSAENQILLNSLADRTDRKAWVVELKTKLKPDERVAILDNYEVEARQSTNVAVLAEAVAWFSEHSEPKRALALLPVDVVKKYPSLLSARLQVLLELDRPEEVRPFLESEKSGVDPYIAHCLQALSALKAGQYQMVTVHFMSAIAACTNQPARLQFVAGYADRDLHCRPRGAASAVRHR